MADAGRPGPGDAADQRAAGPAGQGGTDPAICSARGCTLPASWQLRWNNPRLHTPERRKVWLACTEHRDSLGDFLTARGFLRETEPLGS